MRALASLAEDLGLVPPAASLAIREDELEDWLKHAAPGARIEYHRDFLPLDRDRGLGPLGGRLRRGLVTVAQRARILAEDGRVLLVQERHGERDYSYFAVKSTRQPRRKPATSPSRDAGGD